MGQTQPRHSAVPTTSGQPSNSSARKYHYPLSQEEGEHRRDSPGSGDRAEYAIPGWDDVWIDLGGEG